MQKGNQTHQLELIDDCIAVEIAVSMVGVQVVLFPTKADFRVCMLILDQKGRGGTVHLHLRDGVVMFGQDVS